MRRLEPFWSTASLEQQDRAPDLIARHFAATAAHSRHLQSRYPREDVEPRVMYALYKAAYTYQPGHAGFVHWLKIKILGETSMLRTRQAYRDRHGIRIANLDFSLLDQRFCYRETS